MAEKEEEKKLDLSQFIQDQKKKKNSNLVVFKFNNSSPSQNITPVVEPQKEKSQLLAPDTLHDEPAQPTTFENTLISSRISRKSVMRMKSLAARSLADSLKPKLSNIVQKVIQTKSTVRGSKQRYTDSISSVAATDVIRTFGDLVLYNDEGKPYIDVNKLVYNPRPKAEKELKERFAWYVSDHIFIISNFISLVCSGYLLSIGLSSTSWDPSIESISTNNSPNKLQNTDGPILKAKIGSFVLSPGQIGSVLLACTVLNGINVLIGIFGCIYGYKLLLIQHATLDIVILLLQFVMAIIVMVTGICEESDILGFQEGFENLMRKFSAVATNDEASDDQHYATAQLNDIQLSMQCCGASNWTDYMNPRMLGASENQMSTRVHGFNGIKNVFPFSCCKVWWIRNIYCADGAHIWTRPGAFPIEIKKFRERINQVGCVPRVWLACQRLHFMIGQGLLLNAIAHAVLVIFECVAVVLQIRSLNTILREIKAIEEPLVGENPHDAGSEDSKSKYKRESSVTTDDSQSARTSASYGMKAIDELKSKLALPTEDEIQFIKSRTAFATFESRMKRTNLGQMMIKAKKSVYAGGVDEGTAAFLQHLSQITHPEQNHHPDHHHHHVIHHVGGHHEAYAEFVRSGIIKAEKAKAEKAKAATDKHRPHSKKRLLEAVVKISGNKRKSKSKPRKTSPIAEPLEINPQPLELGVPRHHFKTPRVHKDKQDYNIGIKSQPVDLSVPSHHLKVGKGHHSHHHDHITMESEVKQKPKHKKKHIKKRSEISPEFEKRLDHLQEKIEEHLQEKTVDHLIPIGENHEIGPTATSSMQVEESTSQKPLSKKRKKKRKVKRKKPKSKPAKPANAKPSDWKPFF